MSWCVYILICPLDNCVRYVGITQQIKRRYYIHCLNGNGIKKDNPYKFNWIQKLKEQNLKPIIKEVCGELTKEQACKTEIDLISLYRYLVGDKLVNILDGGNIPPCRYGEDNLSKKEDVRKKNSKSHAGKKHSLLTKQKLSDINKGKTLSNETKLKIGNSHRGFKLSLNHRNKISNNHGRKKSVIQFSLDGIKIKEFSSASEAARELKLSQVNISEVCRGKRNKCGNFIWKFKDG